MVTPLSIPSGLPSPAQSDHLRPLLASHLSRSLSLPAKPSSIPLAQPYIQPLTIALAIQSSLTLHILPRPYSAEDLIPLQAAQHLASILDEALPTRLALDCAVAYPGHAGVVKAVLDMLEEKNSKVWEELEVDLVGPTIRFLAGENRKVIKGGQGTDTIDKTILFLLILARAHLQLAKTILGARQSLDTLTSSYACLSTNTSTPPPPTAIRTKSNILLLLHTLVSPLQQTEREWKLGNVDVAPPSGKETSRRPLVNNSLVEDYKVFFPSGEEEDPSSTTLDDQVISALRSLSTSHPQPQPSSSNSATTNTESTAPATPTELTSIASIHEIYSHLPSHLLLPALRHPRFATAPGGAEAALVNALLEDDLPAELVGLRRVLRGEDAAGLEDEVEEPVAAEVVSEAKAKGNGSGTAGHGKRFKRENIWDEAPMDYNKLKVGKDDPALENLTSSIPDHIRSSILRLTEQQLEEEQAELEAERLEAAERRERGRLASGGSALGGVKVKTVAFEEELDDEERDDLEEEGRAVVRRKRVEAGVASGSGRGGSGYGGEDESEDDDGEPEGMPGSTYPSRSHTPNPASSSTPADSNPTETYLERAYLRDPKVFDRDALTRRSKGRDELRKAVGMSDEQIEGWRIMLERNPRKDKILEKHGLGSGPLNHPPPNNHAGGGSSSNRTPLSRRGGGGSGSGRGGSSGRGGGQDGQGQGGGRGGGQGGNSRGGQNKGSRGHSNAARTRGHDRKMARMGAV